MENNPFHYLPLALWLRSQNRRLSRDVVENLLPAMHDENPRVRALTAQALSAAPMELCLSPLISHLADPDETVAENILSNIRQWLPWTISRPWQPVVNRDTVLDDAIISSLSGESTRETGSRRRLLSRLAELCGAEAEIIRALSSVDMTLAREFTALLRSRMKINHPPQITIITTYRCNANCSYCYAGRYRSDSSPLLDEEQFTQILNHAVQLGYRRVGFTGGEPTLHPRFDRFVDAVRNRGLTMFLATNGTFQTALIDHLDPSFVGTITAHLWFRPSSGHPAEPHFVANIRRLCQRGFRVAIRYTVCDGISIPVDEITSLSHAAGVQQINLALSIPTSDSERKMVSLDRVTAEASRLLDAAKQFIRCKFSVALAKPLVLCAIKPDDLRWIAQTSYNIGTCPLWCVGGTHNLVVNYDGDLQPCIVLSQNLGQFLHYRNRKQIESRSSAVIFALAQRPLFENCNNCNLWHLRRCQGMCLAYKNFGNDSALSDPDR